MIQLTDDRFWLYATVDPAPNRLLHVKLSPTRNQAITEMFLVDSAPWLQAVFHRHGLDYRDEKYGNRNSVERVFRELQRRTNPFSNCFSHAETDAVKN
ncbi:transposase [Natrinema pallidum DSM 3751]|uniref:Transposase n=1 Tax=Natrinema pallidum DSM 3751 TaxID=1227495 RepID=L9YE57_9EURY|nr:transposase [Natrinema pallidum DSM 3751]